MADILTFPEPPKPATPNDLLEEAKDALENVLVIGIDNDGDLYWRTTCTNETANWLLDLTKQEILQPNIAVELEE